MGFLLIVYPYIMCSKFDTDASPECWYACYITTVIDPLINSTSWTLDASYPPNALAFTRVPSNASRREPFGRLETEETVSLWRDAKTRCRLEPPLACYPAMDRWKRGDAGQRGGTKPPLPQIQMPCHEY